MTKCDEYQKHYARLREKMLNVHGWIQLAEEIAVASPNYQSFINARKKLEQKFTALFSTKVVEDAMTTNVETTKPSTLVTEVAKVMADEEIGSVVVTKNGKSGVTVPIISRARGTLP